MEGMAGRRVNFLDMRTPEKKNKKKSLICSCMGSGTRPSEKRKRRGTREVNLEVAL